MVEIHFQVQHTEALPVANLVARLASVLAARADLEVAFSTEELTDWLAHEQLYFLPTGLLVSVYRLRFEWFDDEVLLDKVVNEFLRDVESLTDSLGEGTVRKVLKLHDSLALEKSLRYHREIADLEMQLRGALHYLLLHDGRVNLKEDLGDFSVVNHLTKDKEADAYDEGQAKEYFENQLFHLSFRSYASFDPCEFTDKEVNALLKTAATFEDFKTALDKRRLKTQRHVDFINALKDKMDSVEKLRNAIMHNRAITHKTENNYQKVREPLLQEIRNFWAAEKEVQKEALLQPAYRQLWEKPARQKVERILERTSHWNRLEGCVILRDEYSLEVQEFTSLEDLQIALEFIAEEAAAPYFPPDPELRKLAEETFNSEAVVLQCLQPYRDEAWGLRWVLPNATII